MAITFDGAGGLFTRLGKIFHAIATLNTARGTTVPAEVLDAVDELDGTSVLLRATVADVLPAEESWESGGGSLAAALVEAAGRLVIQQIKDDNPQEADTLEESLRELILQMEAGSETVDASTVAASPTMGASNAGNGTCIASTKRGDGLVNENMLAESIEGDAEDESTFTFRGEVAVDEATSHDWPDGSGANASVSVTTDAGILSNGSFETADANQTTKPDDWDVAVGTLGTTLKMTSVEVQTVAISGTPTGGSYVLHWTNINSLAQWTEPLVWNAPQADVQAALRTILGLEEVTVVTSGTSPNLTHTITFTGVRNPAQLTSTSALTGGAPAIGHATTTAGSASVYLGARSLEFDSDAAQLTQIRQQLAAANLEALGQYAVALRAMVDVVPAAGVITVDLFDGNAVINDQEGTANSFTFNGADLTTSYAVKSGFFRLPRDLPDVVYLRIRISTAISAGTSMFIDHVQMVEATELYAGGPHVAVFEGNAAFQAGDTVTLAVTNDRAGLIQEWFQRAFAMRDLELLLPSDSGGSETILDSLVA